MTSTRSCSIRSGLAAILSVCRVKRPIGASAVSATSEAQERGERDAGAADHEQQQELVGRRVVDVGQRERDGQRAVAADPGHEHPQVSALDRHVGVELAASRWPRARGWPASTGIW